ncbi:MAG: lysophospholipase L1-like esterase [Candidatus Azotimanducaceae bacterium]|jgi:lysophospholipase L1-like esterase
MSFKPRFNAAFKLIALASIVQFAPVANAQGLDVMLLGDSITQGFGSCSYRTTLARSIRSCDIDMVGSRSTPTMSALPTDADCTTTNINHQGHSGYTTTNFLDTTLFSGVPQVRKYVTDANPDVVVLHIGSNDMSKLSRFFPVGTYDIAGSSGTGTIGRIDEMIDEIYLVNPYIKVLVADLIPWFANAAVNDQIVELRNEIYPMVEARKLEGDDINIIDVSTGYTTAMMQIDDIHPNSVGEQHIASRVLSSLVSEGVCPATSISDKVLANNQWQQIGLPADPGINNRVRDIFDNLPSATIGSEWVIYRWDPNAAGGRAYTLLGLDDAMQIGRAYWVLQRTGSDVTIDLPADHSPTPLSQSSQCTSIQGCFAVQLEPDQAAGVKDGLGPFEWDMVGFPLETSANLSPSRVTTSALGPCGSSIGCTIPEAQTSSVMTNVMFNYDGASNTYLLRDSSTAFAPWDGAWVGVLSNGFTTDAEWLVAP